LSVRNLGHDFLILGLDQRIFFRCYGYLSPIVPTPFSQSQVTIAFPRRAQNENE
jgi:hypothetical protein